MEQNQETMKEKKPRGRRRGFKIPPRPALPVKTLWRLATQEEKEKAHMRGAALMEYWIGKASKTEIAKRLEIPPLRIWQLSQQAISGMLVGLLSQPKTRAKGMVLSTEDDPKKLKKRITDLEEQNQRQERLIAVLRTMPSAYETKITTKESSKEEKTDAGEQSETLERISYGSGRTSLRRKKNKGKNSSTSGAT